MGLSASAMTVPLALALALAFTAFRDHHSYNKED